MPRILLEVPLEDFTVEDIFAHPIAVYEHLHTISKTDVENELNDPEAYVPDFDGIMEEHVLGAINPEQLKRAATEWNSVIRRELLQAIDQLLEDAGQKDNANTNPDAVLLDSAATYSLKKAALAADNCFFDFTEHIVDLQNEMGFTYLCATLNEQQLKEIMAAPERYALIPIWVK